MLATDLFHVKSLLERKVPLVWPSMYNMYTRPSVNTLHIGQFSTEWMKMTATSCTGLYIILPENNDKHIVTSTYNNILAGESMNISVLSKTLISETHNPSTTNQTYVPIRLDRRDWHTSQVRINHCRQNVWEHPFRKHQRRYKKWKLGPIPERWHISKSNVRWLRNKGKSQDELAQVPVVPPQRYRRGHLNTSQVAKHVIHQSLVTFQKLPRLFPVQTGWYTVLRTYQCQLFLKGSSVKCVYTKVNREKRSFHSKRNLTSCSKYRSKMSANFWSEYLVLLFSCDVEAPWNRCYVLT